MGGLTDAAYADRRRDNFIVALNCGVAGGTCFCVSMGAGPKAQRGFDLALTELLQPRHEFLVEAGSDRGGSAARADSSSRGLACGRRCGGGRGGGHGGPHGPPARHAGHPGTAAGESRTPALERGGRAVFELCELHHGVPHLLLHHGAGSYDLANQVAVRERTWDSCFTLDFSYLHGGSVRRQTKSRYRQWMTHKLANWIDQFGTSGCVGCGRCITWCPVGIDITEEVAAIRATAGSAGVPHGGT